MSRVAMAFAAIQIAAFLVTTVASAEEVLREWTDVSGKFRTQATYVGTSVDRVALKKENGRQITVPFESLSNKDQDWIQQQHRGAKTRNIVRDAREGTGERAPNKWALIAIGEKYKHFSDLRHTGDDAMKLQERLIQLGFPPEQVIVLHDDAVSQDRKSTCANIRLWVDRLLAGRLVGGGRDIRVEPRLAGPDDMIVFAFSGHGVKLNNVSYLCPPDADLKDPENTMVSTDYLYRRLAAVPNGTRLLLVDACRNSAQPDGGDEARILQVDFAQRQGILAFSSCGPGQTSIEDPSLGQGVFSYFVQAALGGACGETLDDGRVVVRLRQLVTFVVDYVEKYSKNIHEHLQTPHTVGDFEGNPVLGTLAAADAIRKEDLVSPEKRGPNSDSYAFDLEQLKPPGLPRGWNGPNSLAMVYNDSGLPALAGVGDQSVTAKSPPLRLTGDFFIEIETSFYYGTLDLRALGKDGPDFDVRFGYDSRGASVVTYKLPTLQQRSYQVGTPEDSGPLLIRLERRNNEYSVVFNSDDSSRYSYKYDQFADFDGLELTLGHSNIHVYNVRVGPLNVVKPDNRRPLAYRPRVDRDGVPEGWNLIGKARDGKMHMLSPRDAMQTTGDFSLTISARFQGFASYTLTLLGDGGGPSLPIHFLHDVKVAHVVNTSFPEVATRKHYVRSGRPFEIQLVRENGNLTFTVREPGSQYPDSEPQALRGGTFGAFNGMKIDVRSPAFLIEKIEFSPK